ncbi:hypothetical protein [Natrarchaeobius chitinivorans]|uniref:Uncharacterized protein n=1 Tax=Natrarchaeobius chitinivorans TaxID=1679083 RepID=A0A3N6MRC2_NATCH|nr:hypothetical protein [Natrarchaeobius chitinivorans]RQG97206.1 hypothetical protein EA473_03805 [Natrarchaeobius chitinivorans]
MELTRSLVESEARKYRKEAPLALVEEENLETLPGAFESGEYGRRDAAWIVRWYYRRFLGRYPDDERRAAEDRFWDNEFDDVRAAIADVVDATDAADGIDALTRLEAVDVPVASGFLTFVDPEEYVVVGPREWATLFEVGELSRSYPDSPSVEDYETYLERCRSLAEQFDCDLWTVYRALWRISDHVSGSDEVEDGSPTTGGF